MKIFTNLTVQKKEKIWPRIIKFDHKKLCSVILINDVKDLKQIRNSNSKFKNILIYSYIKIL